MNSYLTEICMHYVKYPDSFIQYNWAWLGNRIFAFICFICKLGNISVKHSQDLL